MRRIYLFIGSILVTLSMWAIDIPLTSLAYYLNWHWGLIDMTAGSGSVVFQCDDNNFSGTFTGQSVPWEGRIYSVADTLQASMSPVSQETTYINGYYRKPCISNHTDINDPKNYMTIQGQGSLSASDDTMEAVTITTQMIGLFYYARVLDFSSMDPGQTVCIPISSQDGLGSMLKITYNGLKPNIAADNGSDAYDITFNYEYKGEMSSYPVHCQIDTKLLYPVLFSANIRIGHVELKMAYNN